MNDYKRIPCPDCQGIGILRPLKPIEFAGDTPVVFQMEECPRCHGNRTISVPLTNADRIRSMSDEELADMLQLESGELFCQNKKECGELLDTEDGIPEEMCRACALEWLQQPAKED